MSGTTTVYIVFFYKNENKCELKEKLSRNCCADMTMLKKSTVELTQHIRVNNVNGFFERVEKTACLEPESFQNMGKNKIIETNRQNSIKI